MAPARWADDGRLGGFNLLEGLVDHHLLGIHHVRDDLGGPLGWDLAFLALGALLGERLGISQMQVSRIL